MRPVIALGALGTLLCLCAAIIASGRHLATGDASTITVDQIDPDMLDRPEPDAAPEAEPVPDIAQPEPDSGEPNTTTGYQRIEPRKPLSKIGQAKPPAPKAPNDFDGPALYRPVTNAAGIFEAKGYTVTVAGTEAVDAGEVCSFHGESWPCGVRARAAFRAFLRGRAVTCAVPPDIASGAVTADCRIGSQNVGEWLVENGWARAAGNGPYAEAGKKAQSAGKGIFGPPPRGLD